MMNLRRSSTLDLSGRRALVLLHRVELLSLIGRNQADVDQVERADEAVAQAEPAGASDRVAQRYRPVMLEQDQRRGRVVRDVLQDVPRLVVGEDVDAVLRRLGAGGGASLGKPFFTIDAERPTRAPMTLPKSIASAS